jgi:hypothetical protein
MKTIKELSEDKHVFDPTYIFKEKASPKYNSFTERRLIQKRWL